MSLVAALAMADDGGSDAGEDGDDAGDDKDAAAEQDLVEEK